jgi:hypothetical protein
VVAGGGVDVAGSLCVGVALLAKLAIVMAATASGTPMPHINSLRITGVPRIEPLPTLAPAGTWPACALPRTMFTRFMFPPLFEESSAAFTDGGAPLIDAAKVLGYTLQRQVDASRGL